MKLSDDPSPGVLPTAPSTLRRARRPSVLVAAVLAAALLGPLPVRAQGPGTVAVRPTPLHPEAPEMFDFHSSALLNLHQFLLGSRYATGGEGSDPLAGVEWSVEPAPGERAALAAGVAHYRDAYPGNGDFDPKSLIYLKEALVKVDEGRPWDEVTGPIEGEDGLQVAVPPATAAVLQAALPAYERTLWPAHDQANRLWIETARPLASRHAGTVATLLADAFGRPLEGPFRVDLVATGTRLGAYTTLGPTHLVIESTRDGNQGRAALEVLMHEASHSVLTPRSGPITDRLAAAFAERGAEPPRDLWHAILFYTVGETVREVYAVNGEPGYQPVAETQGVWGRGWQDFRDALDTHWLPFLQGDLPLQLAVAGLVDELAPAEPAQSDGS